MTPPDTLGPTIALAEDGEPMWGLGGLWIVKVSAARTGGTFSLLEVRMQRGVGTPLHRHGADDETFIVGAIVHLPGGETHAWRAESELACFLIIATPQHEDFYRDACVPAPSFTQPPDAGTVDLSVIIPAGRRHGVEVLAPPPEY
jgi:quercetin dioxygenase-like cupin family protein